MHTSNIGDLLIGVGDAMSENTPTLSNMDFVPDLDTFLELAERYPVVPVAVEVLADRDTPVTVFEKLVGAEPGFLLESVEGG